MDIDLDLDFSDRISEFLRSKLQQIKSENLQLEESLHHREEVLQNLRRDFARNNEDSVTLGDVWEKIINDNYVLGVELKNENFSVLSDIVVMLNSTSSSSLLYKSFVISSTDPFKPTSHLSSSAEIIIVFPISSFTDNLSHTISGSVSFQKENKKILLPFPSSILLRPQDVTDNSLIVHSYQLIDGNVRDLLALICSSQKQDFVVVNPDNLSLHLEVDCNFSKINTSFTKELFLVHKLSPVLDGSLLEVEEEFGEKPRLTVYCKNVDVTIALLHHLHNQMIDIVPKSVYQPDLSLDELAESLRSVIKRMWYLEESSGDLKELTLKMAQLEHEGDVLVARVKEKESDSSHSFT